MTPDWLLPARSIPVWVGCHLVDAAAGNGCGVCVWTDDGRPLFSERNGSRMVWRWVRRRFGGVR
jgi:hypothetical protein